MSILHPPVHLYPDIYNPDRNIFILWGGDHTWNNTTGVWNFDNTCYIQWLAERYRGSAVYNQINAQSVTLNTNQVAYATIDVDSNSVLNVSVANGVDAPKGDNIIILALRCSYLPGDPLLLRGGVYVNDQGSYSLRGNKTQYVGNYTGVTWNVNHNLRSEDVIVELKDGSTPSKRVFPETVEYVDEDNVTVTFNDVVTGKAVVLKGVE